MPNSELEKLFADATKIDMAGSVKHIRDWHCHLDDHHRQKYADLIEAQAKLIAHFVRASDGHGREALNNLHTWVLHNYGTAFTDRASQAEFEKRLSAQFEALSLPVALERTAGKCDCAVMCQDLGIQGGCRYIQPARDKLRKLVDVVYQHAGNCFPSADTADSLIDKVFRPTPQPSNNQGESYAKRADSATSFDPEAQFDADRAAEERGPDVLGEKP